MLALNQNNNRYEGQTDAGTFISVSAKRFADDAHNKAVMHVSNEHLSWDERLEAAKAYLLAHGADVYRTRHNGWSVIVVKKQRRAKSA